MAKSSKTRGKIDQLVTGETKDIALINKIAATNDDEKGKSVLIVKPAQSRYPTANNTLPRKTEIRIIASQSMNIFYMEIYVWHQFSRSYL